MEQTKIGTIIFNSAVDGIGKTFNACQGEEEVAIIDIDGKAAKTIPLFPDRLITNYPCMEYHKKSDIAKGVRRGNIDIDRTVSKIYSQVSSVLDNMESYETIVVDPISDLKRIFKDYWILHDKKHRGFISQENIAAWTEINDMLRDNVIQPLIGTARDLNKIILLNSKMSDEYINVDDGHGGLVSVKSGKKIPDTPEWIPYRADIKLLMTKEGEKYFMYWTRANELNLPVKEDITGSNIFKVLRIRKLI